MSTEEKQNLTEEKKNLSKYIYEEFADLSDEQLLHVGSVVLEIFEVYQMALKDAYDRGYKSGVEFQKSIAVIENLTKINIHKNEN